MIYLSLPITGRDQEVQRRIAKAWQRYFEALGHIVINPFDVYDKEIKVRKHYGLPLDMTYDEILELDMKELCKCDTILMFDDWDKSRGCILEKGKAKELGFNILYTKTYLLK